MTIETKTSDIFGLVDEALDRLEKTRPAKTKIRRPTALPKMQIKRSAVPDELNRVDAGNVVYVPEYVLQSMTKALNVNTKRLNVVLLKHLMPLLLSYQTSTTYTSAAIKEGLDVDIDFDPGLQDCIRHVGYLNVVMHFVKHSQLPMSVKKRFMRTFSEQLATHALTAMVDENKADTKRTMMQELQAVVYSRQKNKTEVRTNTESEEKELKPVKKPDSSVAVKKSRRS